MNSSDPCLSLEWIEYNDAHHNHIYDFLGFSNPHLLKYINIIKASNNHLGLISEFYNINLSNYKSHSLSINLSKICRQILLALEYLNAKGICHRLSLESVLIDNFNNIKLARYAFSTTKLEASNLEDILYSSPETIVNLPNGKNLDIRNDIWSLGIILLQLLDVSFTELLSSLSQINLIYAANIAIVIIYHKLLTLSINKRLSFSTIGLDIEIIKSEFYDFNSLLIPRLSRWYTESEIDSIQALPILDELLKFITGYNIIERYHKQLLCNEIPQDIKILSLCFKCLTINYDNRPSASQLLDCFYVNLQSEVIIYNQPSLVDTFDLYLHSDIGKYNTLVPSKYHCNSLIKIKCPLGLRILRKLRLDATITPIAGIYALSIRPSCGYSRLLSKLYNWLRMCRFDHILTQYKDFRRIVKTESRIDFPASHRLIVYLVALDIIKFTTCDTISIDTNKQFHQENYSICNELSRNRVKIALNHLLSTNNDISFYPGLEDICSVLVSLTDNQLIINALFSSIVVKFVKSFYCTSFEMINQTMDKFDCILKFFDPEIHYHLTKLDFRCNSFLIEWLSTLFTHVLSLDRYEDYILYVAMSMIYSCKSQILASNDANRVMKSINTGMMFSHIPMICNMATRLAGIYYKYFSMGMCKNITLIIENSKENGLKAFEKRPIELLSLDEIVGIDLQKLYFLRVIGSVEFYDKFLSKYKYPLVEFQKINL